MSRLLVASVNTLLNWHLYVLSYMCVCFTKYTCTWVNWLILLFVLTVKPHLPENFKEATWEKLKEAVQAIHNKKFVIYSSEELYKAVENMCSHKMAATLYDLLKAECESHVKSNVQQFVWYPFSSYRLILI